MRAAVFRGVGRPLSIELMPEPTPGVGEVVIRVGRCGICGSDVYRSGEEAGGWVPGTIIGHEFAGEVVALGKGVETLKLGDRIACMPVKGSCGVCEACRVGRYMLCRSARPSSQGFAEFVAVGAREGVKLPGSVSLSDGALVEPLAVGLRGVRHAGITPTSRVLVQGPGSVGLAVIWCLRRAGVLTIAVLASSRRREAFAMSMGATHFIVEGPDADAEIAAALGASPDYIFECVGAPGVIARAIGLVKPQGTVVALGFCANADSFIPAQALMKEVRLQFSMTYSLDDFENAADALDDGAVEARTMVTDTIGLAELPGVLEELRGPSHRCKVLVNPHV